MKDLVCARSVFAIMVSFSRKLFKNHWFLVDFSRWNDKTQTILIPSSGQSARPGSSSTSARISSGRGRTR